MYDSYRNIGSYIDGLKPSARKIIHTVRKKNITTPVKVSNLSSTVSIETEYIHGQVSLEGVTVGLAQNFVGTNNINLLKPEGSFGNRSIPEAAASRYIFTCKEKIMDSIFRKEDDVVLIQQEFEGTIIEPRFFLPVVPMLLVNGSVGIGNGFAQKILPRNIENVIAEIEHWLKKGRFQCEYIPIHYNGFAGITTRVEKTDKKTGEITASWEIFGKFEKKPRMRTTLVITELPLGYDLESYLKELDGLEADKVLKGEKWVKVEPVIKGYVDKAKDLDTFCIEVQVDSKFMELDEYVQYDKLKLINRVTENFNSLDETNTIAEFNSEMEVMKAYCELRLNYYEERRQQQLIDMMDRIDMLTQRSMFVKAIVEDRINIKQPKAGVIKDLGDLMFKTRDGSYSYMLNMPVHSLTETTIKELLVEIDELRAQHEDLKNTSPKQIWQRELKQLTKDLK